MDEKTTGSYSFQREARPAAWWLTSLSTSVAVHVALALLFWLADEGVGRSMERMQLLCEGRRRCAMAESYPKRRSVDDRPLPPAGLIQARVVARLGLAEQNPRALPELTKYEQPERIEDGINITKENEKPFKFDKRAFENKKAQLDEQYRKKNRRRSLQDLLDAPEDDDPRMRARHLTKIIGKADGATWGFGTESSEGDSYLNELQIELYKNFLIPSHLPEARVVQLHRILAIQKMTARGEILQYKTLSNSGDKDFDLAAEAAIKRFMPAEGGTLTLPPPTPEMLRQLNSYGLNVEFDGRLFRR